ncbi:YdcF family protein [Methylocaldum sp.]|uniref:YdcF family protein n=1 Tax=Methylocaldum sp. TaxID=1969727 RepID=UPI002D5EF9DB|nr:YdcF family protein [Methylocaldum sp.]HYE34455.1 YdcF family protein [Methylocaldum sp.]
MNWNWFITNLIVAFLLPPLNMLVIGAIGFRQLDKRPRLGRSLIAASLLGLGLLSTPYVSNRLLAALQVPPLPVSGHDAEAIVILGGGIQSSAPEYGDGATLNARTLERVRYGASLYRKTGKPILVTGGAPEGYPAEGPIMHSILEKEFGVPVNWVESESINTRENARFSARILKQAGIRRIYLVSHSWHLPRAIPEFAREGVEVVPAGTGYVSTDSVRPIDLVPGYRAVANSALALHEWIGLVWYRLRG